MSEFAAVTDDDDIYKAERRLRQCAVCPPSGGACAGRYDQDPGHEPYWDGIIKYRYCDKWREYILQDRLGSFGLPERMREKTIESFVATDIKSIEAKNAAARYVHEFSSMRTTNDKNGLLFFGPHGVGKTHMASAVLRELVEKRLLRSAVFVPAISLLNQLRRNGSEVDKAVRRLGAVDLLVLDDLGAQRTSDWAREQLGQIFDDRWANRRPLICTSNIDLDAYAVTLGERAASRLAGMLLVIPLDGVDHR